MGLARDFVRRLKEFELPNLSIIIDSEHEKVTLTEIHLAQN